MAWTEREATQDNFTVWNWNSSLINFLPHDKGESWKGELANLWELVQTPIANSIFLSQAEVKPQMESLFSFSLWILAIPPACLSYSLHHKWDTWGWVPLCQQVVLEKGTNLLKFQPQKVTILMQQRPYSRGPSNSGKALPYRSGPKTCLKNIFFLLTKTIKMVNKSPQITPSDMPWIWTEHSSPMSNLQYLLFSPHISWVEIA